ncbi:MAG: NAD(P)H-quinone oxidoreductase [Myxococcota bacterium]
MHGIRVDADALVWGPVEPVVAGPGEVTIAVAAAGVNRADLAQRAGQYPPPPGASPILGLECSGTVDSVGPGVDPGWLGRPVCALLAGGGYAERVACPVGQLLPVPDGVSLVDAAALPEALCTAWMALSVVGRLGPGERVVWHAGASGVGTIAVQLCKAWGNPVFVTAGTPDKVARCVALGADGGAARSDGPWEPAVRAWAPGGVDLIVDPVARGYLAADQRSLAVDGRIVVLAVLGGAEDTLDLGRLLVKRQTIAGTTLRSRSLVDKARIVAAVRDVCVPLVACGRIRPVIDAVFPLADAELAHRRLASNETVGKLILAL